MSKTRNEVKKLRPIDDVFFEKIIEDKNVCEEILRVILEDTELEVLSENVCHRDILRTYIPVYLWI